jgi:hypothetical protein
MLRVPAEFYQFFSDVVNLDLLALFGDLHTRQIELFRLNFGKIILLSKTNEAEMICFLIVSFNFF